MKNSFIEEILYRAWVEIGTDLININEPRVIRHISEIASDLYGEEVGKYLHTLLSEQGTPPKPPTTLPAQPDGEEDNPEKDIEAIEFGMMTAAEKEEYLKKKKMGLEESGIDIKSILNSKIQNPDTGRQIKVSSGLSYDKTTGGYQAARAKMKDSGVSDDEIEKASEKNDDLGDENKAKKSKSPSNVKLQSEVNNYQSDLENQRDMGKAGAGGPVASQGESRFCNTINTYDDEKFKKKNRKLIDNQKKKYENSKIKSSDARDCRALGLNPNSDEAREYLATRDVFVEQELNRIKNIKDSVFYQQSGFNGNEQAYRDWIKVAYDGTLATRKILEEDTILDVSKPHTCVQSTTEMDNKVQNILESKLEEANQSGNKELIDHYEQEVISFKKYREYHDTYVIGEDANGNTTIVSISNKKDSDLKDPQGNTTPAARYKLIREKYGEKAAKKIVQSLDRGLKEVSDVNLSTINQSNDVKIDDAYSAICDTPQMKQYMDFLRDNKQFNKYLQNNNLSYDNLTTKEKLEYMQKYSKNEIENGKKPPYKPFGKISIKIGEFSQNAKFKKQYPNINFDSPSIKAAIKIKENEKDVVSASHNRVVNDITKADAEDGYPKDGINGPHTQGYITTVLEAMHLNTYIDGGDGRIITQMGIRGAQPKHIRECLAEQSGYSGNLSTKKGRDGLKEHLIKTSIIDSESGAILIKTENGTNKLIEDTWRTAGTVQKVASSYGSDMRSCVSNKIDKKRAS
jgi:hypothetical protein